MKDRVNEPRLILFILERFTDDKFAPSLGVTTDAVALGYDRTAVADTFTVLSSPHGIVKAADGRLLADERYLDRSGRNKSTAYKLTPKGVAERERLRAILKED
jgi:hypothetical protein